MKLVVGTLTGGLVFFFVGWLVYGIALQSTMAAHSVAPEGFAKEAPEMLWMVIGNLSYAALISYIFYQWAGIKTITSGFKGGAIIGLFTGITWDLMQYSMANIMDMGGVLIDIIVFTVVSSVVGAAVGWVLGLLDK